MKFSYHDVVVFVDGVRYKPSKNYAIQLHCTKAGGWQLWHIWDGVEKKIGGEFDSESRNTRYLRKETKECHRAGAIWLGWHGQYRCMIISPCKLASGNLA